MLHTTETFLKAAFDEILAGKHKCCIESATVDWASISLTPKYREFILKLIAKTGLENEIPFEILDAHFFAFFQLVNLALALGTICGISMMYQAGKQTRESLRESLNEDAANLIENLMREALTTEGGPAFMKDGPKGTV